ncbi:MAG: bifunctional precorrin-2 dehydrogenase/sirohydrochlorin ferrochelatase [Lachnospiraceae bacterium]|nr:bifunctional precorrin-2 dehydrogenase/sirohydrochlorin ferrochelatase [Lachnospiraceae bacterium]
MGYFPLFVNLVGKRCVVIGDGKVAERKAESLRMFEGNVSVYAKGEWDYSTLAHAFLVIAATNDRTTNREIAQFCKKQGIFVNVADSKEESTFLFPAVIRQGPVSVGISTQGGSPLISAEIRKKIESVLPEDIGLITELMDDIRDDVKNLPVNPKMKKYIFQSIYEEAKETHGKLKKEEVAAVILRLLNDKDDYISEE